MKTSAAAGTALTCPAVGRTEKKRAWTAPAADRPVVGLAGSNDPSLTRPEPLDALLDTEQVREVVWLALDRDDSPRSLPNIVRRDSWVVIKPNLVTCPVTMNDFHADGIEHWWLVTDLRVVKAVVEYLLTRVGPKRISIAEGPPWYSSGGKLKPEKFVDGWHCAWKEFGGLSYAGVVADLNRRRPGTTVDIIDLNEDEAVYVTDFDARGSGIGALQDVRPKDPDGASDTEWTRRKGIWYPKTILDCDILVTVPVLKTHSSAGVTLCMKNLVGCIHSQQYGRGNSKAPIHQGSQFGLVRGIADLGASIDPDYAVAEGFWSTIQQHHGQNGVGIRHNVVVAGGDVVAAEAVAMMVMGYHPLDSDLLRLLNKKNIGEWRPDRIETAGPELKTLRRNYVRASNTFFARGIRKWLALGPVRKAPENLKDLQPRPGETVEKKTWSILDGDAIIDARVNDNPPFRLQDCLLYDLPGSAGARRNSRWYLALRASTARKDLCGQLLVGISGGGLRAFFNGAEIEYPAEPYRYDPTPTPFLKFREGENLLILEITKRNGKKEPVRIAANLCDLDGDRLTGIELDPANE